MDKKEPTRRDASGKTPADEVEIKKSLKGIRKVLSSFLSEFRRKRNRNSLWRF